MTGAYLRVQRDGKWRTLEVEHLTNKEREERFTDPREAVNWINMLCIQVCENEALLDGLVKDGVLKRGEE